MQVLAMMWAVAAAVVCYKTPLAGGLRRNLLFITPLAMLPTFLKYLSVSTPLVAIGLTIVMTVVFVALVTLGYRLEKKLGVPGLGPQDD